MKEDIGDLSEVARDMEERQTRQVLGRMRMEMTGSTWTIYTFCG
jgi:hypothetical protein